MFTLAHISDVHLAPLPEPSISQLMSKRITGYINWKKNRKSSLGASTLDKIISHLKSQSPTHIAVTGDLTNLALPKEYDNAHMFLESLGTSENVSAICGNHDAYVPGALKNAISTWQPYLSGDDKLTDNESDFPYLRIRDKVAIIGCNSAEATLPFMATGYFREKQAVRLTKLLEETKDMCRVVMIHHPPFHSATPKYKRLIGINLFQETIKTHGAELIIHGHTHLATRTKIAGPNNTVPVICVPAAGQAVGGHKPAAQYNLFKMKKAQKHWQIELQTFGIDQSGEKVMKLSSEILGD